MPRRAGSTIPEPPASLSAAAKARWQTVIPRVVQRGSVDLDTLHAYCQVWARWRQAEDGIAAAGILTKGAGGRVVASPLVAIANQTAAEVRKLEDDLGIELIETPPSQPAAPDGESLVTRRELAQRIGIHMQTVAKWLEEGMPVADRGSRGRAAKFRESDVRAWRAARETAAKRTGLVDVAQERARKERAQAMEAEQRVAIRAKNFLPAVDVERAWAFEINAVRTYALAIPATQADRLTRVATLEGVSGVEAVLIEIVHALLGELSADDRELPPSGEAEAASA